MGYRSATEILNEAKAKRMRKAFFVTALLLEIEAVRAHLTDMGSTCGRDGTIFECGSFVDRGQEWLVIVAETGAGTHPAQNVASQGHFLFGEFEVQILVGIGGSRKKDAPIGSVVASDKVYMPYSGKAGKNGFTHRPVTFPLDPRLVSIARKIRRDKIWPSRVRPVNDGTLPPFDKYPVSYPPIGLVAPIASIEAVLDDPKSELEALLAHGFSDTCVVEMEGYGAIYAASAERTPSIIVRGISDMAQEKSPEDDSMLQPIAACHAAAFAFEILSHWGQLNDRPVSGGQSRPSVPPVAPSAPDPRNEAIPLLKAKVSIVLNLAVDFRPEDKDRIDRFQSSLRAIAADEQIEIISTRAGSLRLFVADPGGSLTKIGAKGLREAIAEREGAELLGVVSIDEFENLQAVQKAFAAASTELLTWPATLPNGERLDRPELSELRRRVEDNVSSTTAVLGAPGAGKSALLATLGAEYAARGWPVLAIKADLLETEVNSEAELRDRLGLYDLPSNLICQLARFGPVLLVIDQLDALAGYLDLRTTRLSILLNLVRKLGRLDNVHIVLSSRLFEFQHDARLKSIQTDSLTLQLPAWSDVMAVLEVQGVSAAGWPADAREVMRSPQALSTYLHLNSRYSSEPFASYQAMLERLWAERVLVSEYGPARDQLATDIAHSMTNEESLWLAKVRFASRLTDIYALTGAGVLTTLDASIGFSHQTLFEFALARSFAREQGRLSKFVLERQDSLFLRPKLWAGLTYLRATDINAYHRELETIWKTASLRAHLRVLLIDFLGAQLKPTDREALLLETALTLGDMRLRAFRALGGSAGWFARFSKSFIADAMVASEELANAQIEVLSRAIDYAVDSVLHLMKERWLPKPENDFRIWAVIQSAVQWTPEILELALVLLSRSEIAPRTIDYQAGVIGLEHPEFALQLVRARLERDLAAALKEAELRAAKARPAFQTREEEIIWHLRESPREPVKRIIEHGHEWDRLAALADQSPQQFLEIMWPWYLRVYGALGRFATEREHYLTYLAPYDADYLFEDEAVSGHREAVLLDALCVAVERIAKTDPDYFSGWVVRNEAVELAPVQRIIAHGIAQQPERLAPLGLEFILSDPRRFFLGSIRDLRSTTKSLVAAVSPFWSDGEIERFERVVRAYRPEPPPDKTRPREKMAWRHSIWRTQLDLLRSLPRHQLSAEAKRQVAEGERRYGDQKDGVIFSGARTIGSVLEANAMAKATDDDIVNAFEKLPDATGWEHPKSWMKGGNIQLSRAFGTFAKDHSDRAVRILSRLDNDAGTRAAAYALDALSEHAEPAIVFDLLRNVMNRGFDGEEFRQSAARALERLSSREVAITDEFIVVLESWLQSPIDSGGLKKSGDNETNLLDTGIIDEKNASEGDAIHRSLLWGYGGLEIVPGGEYPVAEALVNLRLARHEQDEALAFLTAYLDREKSLRVWEQLARFLPFFEATRMEARNALVNRLFAEVPDFIGSPAAGKFLANAQHHDPDFVDRHLDVWKMSDSRAARQTYGEILGITGLVLPELEWGQRRLEDIVVNDALADARVGVALSAANLFHNEKDRARAAHLLVRLLPCGLRGVWEAVFEVFRMLDELTPDSGTIELLGAIAENMEGAPQLNATFVIDRLATLLPHGGFLVGRIALGLINNWRSELGDIRTATAMAASQLADLAVTLHRLGPETREVGTTLFEQLVGIDAYEARQMLDEIDNRFRESMPTPKRRLRRRSEMSLKRGDKTLS